MIEKKNTPEDIIQYSISKKDLSITHKMNEEIRTGYFKVKEESSDGEDTVTCIIPLGALKMELGNSIIGTSTIKII